MIRAATVMGPPCDKGHGADAGATPRYEKGGRCVLCRHAYDKARDARRESRRPRAAPRPLPASSRAEARAAGLPTYHGQPCALGHTVRYTKCRRCAVCQRDEKARDYAHRTHGPGPAATLAPVFAINSTWAPVVLWYSPVTTEAA